MILSTDLAGEKKMTHQSTSAIMKKLLAGILSLILNPPLLLAGPSGQTLRDLKRHPLQTRPRPAKLAPDLEELLAQDELTATGKKPAITRTLAEVRHQKNAELARRVVGEGMIPSAEVAAEEKQSFILKLDDLASGAALKTKLASFGGRISRKLDGLGLVVIELPRTKVRQLAADGSIAYISPDRPVSAMGHLETTTGAAQVRALIRDNSLDGAGIGIAILDSGIDPSHRLTTNSDAHPGIVYQQDFTGLGIPKNREDVYGHGTHVASLATGYAKDGTLAKTRPYDGIAPGAEVINLRVLDDHGRGSASRIIAALDWCVTHKATYNLRVINLSLGTSVRDSYRNDPLCLAARRAVNAGIVVVAAAGNSGKDASGREIYGGINSPAIEPSVITVGAANTFGTDARSDDKVTTYSSRGPTRGYTTDASGVRHYDNLIKPDLVAPGNKIIGACSRDGKSPNLLATNYSSLLVTSKAAVQDRIMYMSGTSMAAPVVAGAVALMLQSNPHLTPNLVKAMLMYSAQPLKGFNTFEQGAGELNIDGAVRLARLVKSNLSTLTNGAAMLTAALPLQSSTIAGQSFAWGQGVITNYGFLSGSDLMTYWQGAYANGVMLTDSTSVINGVFTRSSTLTSSGVRLTSGAVQINSGSVTLASGIVFADSQLLAEGIVFADSTMLAKGIVFADDRMLADASLSAFTSFEGDHSACMQSAD